MIRILIAVIILSLAPISVACADRVLMASGDSLTGRVVRLEEGTLYLQTDYAEEPLRLPWQEIASVATDRAVTVVFRSGEVVKGRLGPGRDAARFALSGDLVDVGEVSMRDVSAINPPAKKTASIDGSITLGGNRQSGNTDRNALSAAGDAVFRERRHRATLGLLYNYAEEDDAVTERNAFGRFKYDNFFTEQVYGYLNTEFLYDKFKDLNLRTVVGPGFGYQVWDADVRSLAFEAGLAYYNEDRNVGEDDSWVTARLAAIFSYTFGNGLAFSESLTLYPSLEETGELTLRNEASLTSPIAFGWALQLRNIIEHDSDPDSAQVEKTDYSWILGLNYAF